MHRGVVHPFSGRLWLMAATADYAINHSYCEGPFYILLDHVQEFLGWRGGNERPWVCAWMVGGLLL